MKQTILNDRGQKRGSSSTRDASVTPSSGYHPTITRKQMQYREATRQFLRFAQQLAEMERLLRFRHVYVVRRGFRWYG